MSELYAVVRKVLWKGTVTLKKGRDAGKSIKMTRCEAWDGRNPTRQVAGWRKDVEEGDVLVLYSPKETEYAGRSTPHQSPVKQWTYRKIEILKPPTYEMLSPAVEQNVKDKNRRKQVLDILKKTEPNKIVVKALELGLDFPMFIEQIRKTQTNLKQTVEELEQRLKAILELVRTIKGWL